MSGIFEDTLSSPDIEQTIKDLSNRKNIWKGTKLENYHTWANTQQGSFGEKYVSRIFLSNGHCVAKRENPDHDRIINGIKTEIKFSIQKDKPFDFVFNHISVGKDWNRIVFCGLNLKMETSVLLWLTKEDFITMVETLKINRAQGGNKMKNDDFIISGPNVCHKAIKFSHIKTLNDWEFTKTGLLMYYD
jgi:hypothetical protein